MSRSNTGTHWKRPSTHVYDYNYSIGEHYYKPQLSYADKRGHLRDRGTPPRAKTFAERFADDPVYGNYGPPRWRTSNTGSMFSQPRRASFGDDLGLGRRTFDDGEFSLGRKPANEESTRRKLFNEDDLFARKQPFTEDEPRLNDEGGRPRFNFGERLMDAAGTRLGTRATPKSAGVLDDPFEDEFFRKPKRNIPKAAEAEDNSFKQRTAAKTLNFDDDDDDDYSRDAESVISRIRSKLRAKREKEEGQNSVFDTEDFGLSRPEQLRSKVKTRAYNLDDDFGGMNLDSKSREQINRISNLSSKYLDDDDLSGMTGGSRSVQIKRRTVRSTFDD